MSLIPYIDALIISGATMLLLHPLSLKYITTYTASPIWTMIVIGVIVWAVSFIVIALRLKLISESHQARRSRSGRIRPHHSPTSDRSWVSRSDDANVDRPMNGRKSSRFGDADPHARPSRIQVQLETTSS
jgi:hypothetical protein